jgi:2,3-bisphosphoglycerate-dependent phosphoglycerate mutase
MATELILIRHGNAVRVNGDYRHAPLTPLGREQAARTGQHLRLEYEPLSALYTSSLLRARETAAIIAEQVGAIPQVEAGIREMELHEVLLLALLEGLDFLNPVEDYLPTHAGKPNRWPLVGRVSRVLLGVVASHPNQRVAIIAHSGVISSTLAWFFPAQRLRWWTTLAGNCSLTRLQVDGAQAEVLAIADARHLASVTATAQLPARAAKAAAHVVREGTPHEADRG